MIEWRSKQVAINDDDASDQNAWTKLAGFMALIEDTLPGDGRPMNYIWLDYTEFKRDLSNAVGNALHLI